MGSPFKGAIDASLHYCSPEKAVRDNDNAGIVTRMFSYSNDNNRLNNKTKQHEGL